MPSLVLGLEDFFNLAFTGVLERVSVEVRDVDVAEVIV
jgi:hypothetical protein